VVRFRRQRLDLTGEAERDGGGQQGRPRVGAGQPDRPAHRREDLAALDLDDRPDDGEERQYDEPGYDEQHEAGQGGERDEQVGGDQPPPVQGPRDLGEGHGRLAALGRADQPADEAGQQHGADQADPGGAE
jgi:hypothetical protein